LPNVRIRGKIPREEWPKIAARFQSGVTLTEIARSYDCTAPAIRYIVGRVPMPGSKGRKMEPDKQERIAMLVPPAENRRTTRIGSTSDRSDISRGRSGLSPDTTTKDLWGRVNTDIATFLAAIDSLFSDDSDSNYEALLAATDRLLWASARTRLELERVLRNRRKGASLRRISG
jgi:transposase-like protein